MRKDVKMKKSYDLLAMGELLLRLSPEGRICEEGVLRRYIGGAELNVAAGVAGLGLCSGIISKIPEHAIGRYVRNSCRCHRVSDAYLKDDARREARLGVYYYEQGAGPRKPEVVYDRMHTSVREIRMEDFPDDMYKQTRCFHTSGITLALGKNCRETAIGMMKRFKENGVKISFDVNYRSNLWSGEEARKCIEEILPYVDIFFCSDSTARLTFGKMGDTRQIMKEFAQEYPVSVVASTRRVVHSPRKHSFGSVIYETSSGRFYEEEDYKEIEVIDRIGSGDAYVAGVLYGLLSGEGCQRAMEIGNAMGAFKNTIPGDLCGADLRDIEKMIQDHKAKDEQVEMIR